MLHLNSALEGVRLVGGAAPAQFNAINGMPLNSIVHTMMCQVIRPWAVNIVKGKAALAWGMSLLLEKLCHRTKAPTLNRCGRNAEVGCGCCRNS